MKICFQIPIKKLAFAQPRFGPPNISSCLNECFALIAAEKIGAHMKYIAFYFTFTAALHCFAGDAQESIDLSAAHTCDLEDQTSHLFLNEDSTNCRIVLEPHLIEGGLRTMVGLAVGLVLGFPGLFLSDCLSLAVLNIYHHSSCCRMSDDDKEL